MKRKHRIDKQKELEAIAANERLGMISASEAAWQRIKTVVIKKGHA